MCHRVSRRPSLPVPARRIDRSLVFAPTKPSSLVSPAAQVEVSTFCWTNTISRGSCAAAAVTNDSACAPPSLLADRCFPHPCFPVIRTAELHFTAFKYSVTPPPMSQSFVKLPASVVEVTGSLFPTLCGLIAQRFVHYVQVAYSPSVTGTPFNGDTHCIVLTSQGSLVLVQSRFGVLLNTLV